MITTPKKAATIASSKLKENQNQHCPKSKQMQYHQEQEPLLPHYVLNPAPFYHPALQRRPYPHAPALPLHDLGSGPQPLFGWPSVIPRPHSYGQPKYWRYQKPDYRRFCYSVGKAEVSFAALPGGPLYGYPTHMRENPVSRW
ncbi:hypothetical protein V865_004234 [Kwoniella europaea PYCC6329]|uniref:Uncharacterized protein n=1 Tax=Kwoniella europaea PYCC6329 TaxID=1423913 RepID=A0AAX4KJD0_9TREE